jgi:hypothetical protein
MRLPAKTAGVRADSSRLKPIKVVFILSVYFFTMRIQINSAANRYKATIKPMIAMPLKPIKNFLLQVKQSGSQKPAHGSDQKS